MRILSSRIQMYKTVCLPLNVDTFEKSENFGIDYGSFL